MFLAAHENSRSGQGCPDCMSHVERMNGRQKSPALYSHVQIALEGILICNSLEQGHVTQKDGKGLQDLNILFG